jgi:hypothetical protein
MVEMRGLFSLVSLLIVLTIVGMIAKRQLTAASLHQAGPASSSASQPRQLEKQVQDDVNRLMQGRASDLEQQQAEPKP